MGCCCSSDTVSAERRHPLLREQHTLSTDGPASTPPSSLEHKKSSIIEGNNFDFNHIQNRAIVDSLRGPPISVIMDPDPKKSPQIIRSALNGFMRIEYFSLPEEVPVHVWYKLHLKDLIEHIRVFNVLIHHHCSSRNTCKVMMGAPNTVYNWTYTKDGDFSEDICKTISASKFFENVIDTASVILKAHFSRSKTVMDKAATQASKVIVSMVFKSYCHLLYHHHDLFASSYALVHLNNCFTWFVLFSTEANLLDIEESQPLQVLIAEIVEAGKSGELFGSGYDDERDGLQLSVSSRHDRLSSFFESLSSGSEISKMTATSYGTEHTLYSTSNT